MSQTPLNHDAAPAAAVRLRLPERAQVELKYACADDLIGPAHPARLVWDVVCTWDLSAFTASARARDGVGGRDVTDPRILAAVWLYGCVRGIGSARELARRCDAGPAGEGSRPFLWLCGGVTLNHHTLSDFRVAHADALDRLFSRSIAALVKRRLVTVREVAQDGTRVRANAGTSSFRRKATLAKLLAAAADAHVAAVRAMSADDESNGGGRAAKQKAARVRAAQGRRDRVAAAIALIPQLEQKQQTLAKRKSAKQKAKVKEPRASTTDDQARVMRMPDGGFRPAVNVQVAVDTGSRAIVGVDATNAGADAGLAEPMRRQVEARAGAGGGGGGGGQRVESHLVDGGYLVTADVERAAADGVALFVPPKPPRNKDKRGSEYEPRPGDSDALKAWRTRMASDAGKATYARRAATVETANAQLKAHGLTALTVRGLAKAKCVALWCALAYNLTLFGRAMIG